MLGVTSRTDTDTHTHKHTHITLCRSEQQSLESQIKAVKVTNSMQGAGGGDQLMAKQTDNDTASSSQRKNT